MKTSMRHFHALIGLFVTLALPFMLLMASLRLLLSPAFLRMEYTRAGFPADSYGFTTGDRLEYGMYALDYLFSADGIESLAARRLPGELCWPLTLSPAGCPLFNDNELRHLEDVKAILAPGFAAALLCLVFILICLVAGLLPACAGECRHRLFQAMRAGLRRGATLAIAAILCLALVALAGWDRAFDSFHELFFAAGTWRFPFSDSLIRLYPEQLFMDAAIVIAGLTLAGALLTLAMVAAWARRSSYRA